MDTKEISEKRGSNLITFLESANYDIDDIIKNYLQFLVDPHLSEAAKDTKNSLSEIKGIFGNARDKLNGKLSPNESKILQQHGLLKGRELNRKLSIHKSIGEEWDRVKEEWNKIVTELKNWGHDLRKKGSNAIGGIINYVKRHVVPIMDVLRGHLGNLLDSIQSILKSLKDLIPGLGLIIEFIDFLKILTKEISHYRARTREKMTTK